MAGCRGGVGSHAGLADQGWKDSSDAPRFRDGRDATAPIALVEARGYAVEAARCAATLFDAFGGGDAQGLRSWVAAMRDRFREHFWVGDEESSWLAVAIDGEGRAVDGVWSSMGHVLGTGALEAEGLRLRASARSARLVHEALEGKRIIPRL